MGVRNATDKGRLVHQNGGLGQQRVGEDAAAPRQKSPRPPSAGGPGSGSGDDASTRAESERGS
ncbi:MAG: hypothetical protein KKG14_09235 [Alphaproteobacteria bacterium]|nr:hypothetical protein [Alphaproteobacteria bacterium]MBU2271481.1 hypothetical protein [Alphaproteobacteria bacterium]MBU2418870.1 hypothetical protein [Alphaproteobacteria bacterium]